MSIEIRIASTPKEIKQYIRFAWSIYKQDESLKKNWVPHLISDYMKTLDTKRFPLWKHAERICFTAWKNNLMVGTITAIINYRHLDFHKDGVGFWGFFECINDTQVSETLFNAAAQWLKSKGLTTMRGPISPSMNDQPGMLFDGYDSPPVFLMTYNPPYYHDLCKFHNFKPAQELLTWRIDKEGAMKSLSRLKRISELVKKRETITIRHANLKKFEDEVHRVLDVYNKAWEENWGFVPMTDREFKELARSLKQIVDPGLVYFAENSEGEPVGFSISLPDMNYPLMFTNGNPLTLTGIIKFLWYKRKITKIRTIVMGIIKSYRNKGIDSVFISETMDYAMKKGITDCEVGWVLGSNVPMNRLANTIGAKVHKRYLIYEKELSN